MVAVGGGMVAVGGATVGAGGAGVDVGGCWVGRIVAVGWMVGVAAGIVGEGG